MFFSLTFIIIFIAAAGLKFLSLRVDWAKNLPPKPETTLSLIIAAAHWALSLALFSSILITLNYSVRRSYFPLMTIVFVMVLSFFITFGLSVFLDQWKAVPPSQNSGISLGGNGLVLTNLLNRNETAVVLLNGSMEPLGPRVTAIPGQPLSYQRSVSSNFDLPPVPFGDDTPWFLKSLSIDIRLNGELVQRKYQDGFSSFLLYTGSLIFLLCSLGYAVKISVWPLANLFIATLAFRCVLAFVTFFNTPEMTEITASFLDNKLPVEYGLPLLFLGFGALVNIYSLLDFAARRRYDDD